MEWKENLWWRLEFMSVNQENRGRVWKWVDIFMVWKWLRMITCMKCIYIRWWWWWWWWWHAMQSNATQYICLDSWFKWWWELIWRFSSGSKIAVRFESKKMSYYFVCCGSLVLYSDRVWVYAYMQYDLERKVTSGARLRREQSTT